MTPFCVEGESAHLLQPRHRAAAAAADSPPLPEGGAAQLAAVSRGGGAEGPEGTQVWRW